MNCRSSPTTPPDYFAQRLARNDMERMSIARPMSGEIAETAEAAIAREKQLKASSRWRKLELIKSMNPTWRDLSVDP